MKTLVVTLSIFAAGAAAGQSLWEGNTRGNLYRDTKARAVGDLLTVQIDERSEVSKDASRSSNKEHTLDMGVDAFSLFGLAGKDLPATKWDSKRDFTSASEFTSSDTLSKRLSVVVKEILPNGNILIEGKRQITAAGDVTTITITGIVRPEDIRADNSVPSELVADAKIAYDGKGPWANSTRRGWFLRVLDAIWPF